MDIQLVKIKQCELKSAWLMQKIGFIDIFLKYFDIISPVLQGYTRFVKKANCVDMYWILMNGKKAGEIWIGERDGICYIANLFVLKKYRNKGVAQRVITLAEDLYPRHNVWRLDTIKQEKANCHLYEKLGYIPAGVEKKINKRMTIIDYEKRKGDPNEKRNN
ncbi:MAG: GNAT family N-acetyltransferase [Eubacterium sp.]|nr:GNAT family N-acetyltransferase [Eubacterium sp.]